MNSFLQNDTDAEMDRYQEANEFAAAAFDPMAEKVQKLRYNSTTRKNDIVLPMQAGGFFKIGEADLPQPDVMDAAPEKPLDMRVQDVKDYSAQVKEQQGSVSSEDLEAAGFDPQVIEMAEPKTLSTDAIAQALSDGTPMFDERDPNIRENGFFGTLDFLKDVGFDETSANFIADAMWGYKNPVGTGVMDFATLGIMDIQEGAQLYKDGKTTGSNVSKGLGIVLIAAGIAEATGVGVVVSKKIKANLPAIQKALQQMGTRLNQPGEMPTTSSFGVGEFAPGQSPQKLETPDINTQVDAARIAYESNPNDSSLKKQYLTLRRERDADPVAQIEAPTETKPGIIAFHGSGLNFNKFKLEKIGTGEGNQAFGYGLYFTDSKDIAKFYRDSVGMGNKVKYKGKTVQDLDNDFASKEENIAHMVGQQNNKKDRVRVIENEIAMTQRNLSGIQQSIKDNKSNPKVYPLKFHGMELELEKAVEIEADFQDRLNAAVEVQKNISSIETQPSGKLYKVGIEPTENELLNYDVGFQDQTPFIQTAIEKVLDQINVDDAINLGIDVFSPPYNGNEQAALQAAKDQMLRDFSVVRFLNDWSVLRGAENSGEQLLEGAGVKGITYKANQGVGARNAPETGTRNYVIFDDKMIKILEKYGIVGPVAIGAMAATPKEQQDET